MQYPKCIKQNNPCPKHSNQQYLKHACGEKYMPKIRQPYSADRLKNMSEAAKKYNIKPPSRKGSKLSEEQRKKMSIYLKGINSGGKQWNWKGGISEKNKLIRASFEYKQWREAVFKRDNWTCQKYGIKGGILHPHHIKNFSEYPELRFEINNGITLSKNAHNEFHKIHGRTKNNITQINNFIKTYENNNI